uniref:Replication enhancer n=1 Tax=Tomato yellow leaf curl virus TaxID=10832 RepID=A0A2S1CFV2_9GEMI|nr:C3 [Tomato yellow leaf curl virus]AWD30793.1 C3 [Tomato yellow leaf curl virus]
MDSRTGELITAPQAENGVFIWEINNPLYFKITDHSQRAISNEPRHHFHSDKIQPQHQEGNGDSQMFSQLPNLDDITASDWSFLKSI